MKQEIHSAYLEHYKKVLGPINDKENELANGFADYFARFFTEELSRIPGLREALQAPDPD
jgi:hypothetical protein